MKTLVIIVDIDGTIALKGNRSPHDFDKVDQDLPNTKVLEVIESLLLTKPDLDIIFVSGRMEACRQKTLKWIEKYCPFVIKKPFKLLMRSNDDFREDHVIKQEIFQNHIAPEYDTYLIFDDRSRVVQMWRSLGLTCLQVADGNF
jgi:hypothetical protein